MPNVWPFGSNCCPSTVSCSLSSGFGLLHLSNRLPDCITILSVGFCLAMSLGLSTSGIVCRCCLDISLVYPEVA